MMQEGTAYSPVVATSDGAARVELAADHPGVLDEDYRATLDLLASVTTNIMGRTICALGDAASMPVQSFIKHFHDEFAYHIEHKKCLVPVDVQRAGSGFFTARA